MVYGKSLKRGIKCVVLTAALLLPWPQGISPALATELTGETPATETTTPETPASEAPVTQGTVQGNVTDENGNPLPGAILSLVNKDGQSVSQSQPTNDDGYYALDIPAGTYQVQAAYTAGEKTATVKKEQVTVPENGKVRINFSLGFGAGRSTGALKGQVSGLADQTELALQLVDEHNGYIWDITPDAKGMYQIGAIPPGSYALAASWTDADGKQLGAKEKITISKGKTSVKNISLTSRDADEDNANKRVKSLQKSLNQSKLSLLPGESQIVELTAKYSDKSEEDVTEKATWRSTNEKVATVEKGVITAVGYGKAEIIAEYGGKSLRIQVDISVRSLSSSVKSVNLLPGESVEISIFAELNDRSKVKIPADQVSWKSDDTKVASVEAGIVTVHAYGKATITAAYGGKQLKIKVTNELKRLESNLKKLVLKPGEEKEIAVYAVLGNSSKNDVTGQVKWKISNDSVVELKDGKLIARKFGKANLTGEYGGKKVTVSVDVSLKKLTAKPGSITLKVNEETRLSLTATFGDGTVQTVEAEEWKVRDASIASVEDGVLKAKKAGKTQVTGTFGNKKVTIKVTVEK